MIRKKVPIPRRVRRRAFGALLLALPLCGLALQPAPAWAQPSPNPPTALGNAPLSPEQKGEIERILSISRYEEFCKNALDLKLENATLEQTRGRIKAAFPNQQVEIRERDARPLKVSIDLKETTVGSVLTAVATLADCKLWVLPDGLLIAPPGKLNTVERELVEKKMGGEWAQSVQAGGQAWSNQAIGQKALAKVIAQEVPDTVKTTFANFSPQAQAALQQLATWAREDSRAVRPTMQPFILAPDSPVQIDATEPNWISIDLSGGASDPHAGSMLMKIRL